MPRIRLPSPVQNHRRSHPRAPIPSLIMCPSWGFFEQRTWVSLFGRLVIAYIYDNNFVMGGGGEGEILMEME